MRYQCALGMVLVWRGFCQPPLTPNQMEELTENLKAAHELSLGALGRPSHPERPSGDSISLAQLKHKAPRQAKKALLNATKLSQAGEHEKAIAQLQSAVLRDPDFIEAHDWLALEYARLNRYSDARASIQRVVDLDPNYFGGHYNLGVILVELGDLSAAERSARRAMEISGSNPLAHLLMGFLLCTRQESRAEGVRHLQYAARTLPEARNFLERLKVSGATR